MPFLYSALYPACHGCRVSGIVIIVPSARVGVSSFARGNGCQYSNWDRGGWVWLFFIVSCPLTVLGALFPFVSRGGKGQGENYLLRVSSVVRSHT